MPAITMPSQVQVSMPAANAAVTEAPPSGDPGYISVRAFDFFYGASQAIHGVNMEIP